MTSYIRDFIEEVEGTRSIADRDERSPTSPATTSRSRPLRRTPIGGTTRDRGSAPMPLATVVGYADGIPVTIGSLMTGGMLDHRPTVSEWSTLGPSLRKRLRSYNIGGTEGRRSGWGREMPKHIGDLGYSADELREIAMANSPPGGGGGGGGGGGSLGPIYMAPDEDQVRDYVKAYVVATVGKTNTDLINKGVEAFLNADRAGFDSEDQAYDPATAMKNAIRSTDPYKAVHQRRPESVDEMDWVTSRQGQLRQLGLSASLAEEVGIETSIAGAATPAVQGAGEVAQAGATGRLLESQRDRLKNRAIVAARLM